MPVEFRESAELAVSGLLEHAHIRSFCYSEPGSVQNHMFLLGETDNLSVSGGRLCTRALKADSFVGLPHLPLKWPAIWALMSLCCRRSVVLAITYVASLVKGLIREDATCLWIDRLAMASTFQSPKWKTSLKLSPLPLVVAASLDRCRLGLGVLNPRIWASS